VVNSKFIKKLFGLVQWLKTGEIEENGPAGLDRLILFPAIVVGNELLDIAIPHAKLGKEIEIRRQTPSG
jgi:hypothetical protein